MQLRVSDFIRFAILVYHQFGGFPRFLRPRPYSLRTCGCIHAVPSLRRRECASCATSASSSSCLKGPFCRKVPSRGTTHHPHWKFQDFARLSGNSARRHAPANGDLTRCYLTCVTSFRTNG